MSRALFVAALLAARPAFAEADFTAGRKSFTVVPRPTSLEILAWPPDCLAKPKTMLSPRPVPFPTSLVVKKGSKACACTWGGMPTPLSVTAIMT